MQKEATARNNITIDNVIAELEEARQTAKQSGNASAMVSATLGKAKVLGLDKGEHKEDSPSKAEKIILEVIDARKPQAINLQ